MEEGDPYDPPPIPAPQGGQPPRLEPTKRPSRELGRATDVEADNLLEISDNIRSIGKQAA